VEWWNDAELPPVWWRPRKENIINWGAKEWKVKREFVGRIREFKLEILASSRGKTIRSSNSLGFWYTGKSHPQVEESFPGGPTGNLKKEKAPCASYKGISRELRKERDIENTTMKFRFMDG
jgi:hypothetical protein